MWTCYLSLFVCIAEEMLGTQQFDDKPTFRAYALLLTCYCYTSDDKTELFVQGELYQQL